MSNQSQSVFLSKAKTLLQQSGYQVEEGKLFKGSFGFVFFVKDDQNKKLAVKAISLDSYGTTDQNAKALKEAKQEAENMLLAKGNNVIKLIKYFSQDNVFFIVMERAIMSLEDHIEKEYSEKIISEKQFFEYASQLVEGMNFLHRKGIMLRDMKPGNILLCEQDQLKYCDFGMSKRFSSSECMEEYKQSSFKGSWMFYPPEVMEILNNNKINEKFLKNNPIKQTQKGDIWALGITLLCLLGAQPFSSIQLSCGMNEFQKEKNGSEKINEFLRFILKKNEQERPTIIRVQQKLFELFPAYFSKDLVSQSLISMRKGFKFAEAELLLQSAIEADPTNSKAYSTMAFSLYSRKDPLLIPKALELLKKALQINPNNEEALILISSSEFESKKEMQQKLRTKALQINDKNPFVLVVSGYFEDQKNNVNSALEYYQKVIKEDENYAIAYRNLGAVQLEEQNNPEKALETFQLGLGRNYCDSFLLERMSNIYFDYYNKKELGELCLQIAIRLNPTFCNTIDTLGLYYYNEEQFEKSLPLFQECVLHDPSDKDYRQHLVANLKALNRYAEAEKEAEELFVNGSNNPIHYFWYGQVLADQNKHKEAAQQFEKALTFDSNDYETLVQYSISLSQLGEKKKALEFAEKANQLNPKNNEIEKHISQLKNEIKK